MQQAWGRVRLTEVNPHLVCVLCHGYFIDATTMAECPHSFCRSCIVLYLETKSYCPICEVQIHKTKPHLNLKPDKTLQDIVYKLVPGLYHEEMRRRKEFYAKYPNRDLYLSPEARGVGVERIIYSPEDLISLSLEYYDEKTEVEAEGRRLRKKEALANRSDREREEWAPTRPGTQPVVPHQQVTADTDGLKRYLQCPAVVTMSHLKKFLRLKYGLSTACTVEILYRRESLPDSYSLMDIAYIYTWKRNGPMRFYYRIHVPTTLKTILPPLKASSEPIRDLGPPKKLPGSELLDAVGLRPKPPEPQTVEPLIMLPQKENITQEKALGEKEKTVNATPALTKEEKERVVMSPEESNAVNQLLALSTGHVPTTSAPIKAPELPELPAPVVTTAVESAAPAATTVTSTPAATTTTTTAPAEPAKPTTGNGNVFKVPQSMTKRFVFNGGKLVAVKNKQSNGKASGKPGERTKVNGKLLNGDNSVDRFSNPLGLGGMQGGKLPPGSPRPPPNSEKIVKTKYMPPAGLLMSRLPEVTVSQNNYPVEHPAPVNTQIPQVSSSQTQPKPFQNPNRSVKVNGNKPALTNGQPPHRKECNRLEQIVQNCLKKETTQKKEEEARCEANGVKRSGTLGANGNGEASVAARAASSIRPPDHGEADRVDSAASESSILKRKLNDNPIDKRSSLEGPGDPKKRRLVTPDVSIELTTHPSKDKQKERKREPSDLSTLTKRFLHDIQRTSLQKIDSELKINKLDSMCGSTVKIEKVPAPPSQSASAPKTGVSSTEKAKPIDSTDYSSEDDQLFIDIRNKCEALKRKNPEPVSIAIERVSEDPTAKTVPSQASPSPSPSPSTDDEPVTPTTSSTPPVSTASAETSPKPSGTHKKLPRLIEINAPARPKLPSLIPDPKQKTGVKMTTVRKEVPLKKKVVPVVRRDSNGALDLSSGTSPPNKNGSKSPFPRPSSAEKSPTPSALSPLLAMTSFPMPETKSPPIRIPNLKPKTSPNPRPSSLSSSSPSPPAEPRAASEVFPSAAYQQLYRHQMELQSRFLASQVNNNNWSRDPLTAKKFEDWMRNVMNLPHHPLMYQSQLSPESGRK